MSLEVRIGLCLERETHIGHCPTVSTTLGLCLWECLFHSFPSLQILGFSSLCACAIISLLALCSRHSLSLTLWNRNTPWSRALLEKLTGSQLVKKFPAFYGTRRFINRIHKCPPPVPILSQLDPVHNTITHFLKIHLNTFAASYLNTQGLNNSCLKSPASTLLDLTFQSRALRSFSLNQLCNLSL